MDKLDNAFKRNIKKIVEVKKNLSQKNLKKVIEKETKVKKLGNGQDFVVNL